MIVSNCYAEFLKLINYKVINPDVDYNKLNKKGVSVSMTIDRE